LGVFVGSKSKEEGVMRKEKAENSDFIIQGVQFDRRGCSTSPSQVFNLTDAGVQFVPPYSFWAYTLPKQQREKSAQTH